MLTKWQTVLIPRQKKKYVVSALQKLGMGGWFPPFFHKYSGSKRNLGRVGKPETHKFCLLI